MRTSIAALLIITALPLVACGKSPSDKLADRVENAADARADGMEADADVLRNQAAMLDDRADKARDIAEAHSDAIQAADTNGTSMTQARRDAIVANQAAAVR